MAATRTVLLLVGPKGSGKTFIGTLLSERLGVPFLRVEPIFLASQRSSSLQGVARDAEGFDQVLVEVERRLASDQTLALESTGASEAFRPFLAALREQARVVLVAVRAPLERCQERVRTRDPGGHIDVSDHRVLEINRIAAQLQLDWDLVLDNSGPAPAAVILEAVRPLLVGPPHHRGGHLVQ
jgi:shikimate kinase